MFVILLWTSFGFRQEGLSELGVRPDLASASISLENEGRGPLEQAIHLLVNIANSHFSDVFLELVQLDSSITLNLSKTMSTFRVNSYSLSLCFSMFM